MTMAEFIEVIRACAGDPDDYDLDGDILDLPFGDLGYDSIALLEVSARLKHVHGIELGENDFTGLISPRAALDLINDVREHEVA